MQSCGKLQMLGTSTKSFLNQAFIVKLAIKFETFKSSIVRII